MFRMILFTQWMWSRTVLLVATLAAFALPVLSARHGDLLGAEGGSIREYLAGLEAIGVLYPLLAGTVGLMLALAAWGPDHRGRHVYALILPVPRWHYALLRFTAGLTLLALPVLALWIAALISAASTTLPLGLTAYPTALAARFGLAALVAYAAFSAIAAGTSRTASYVLASIGLLLLAQLLLSLVGSHVNILDPILDWILIWPGPLQVFSGRWMLIDV
jgi:hypothetical protein